MDPKKWEDQQKKVTVSRTGKEFSYESPVPGIHIYNDIFPSSMILMKKLEDENIFEREDYLEDNGMAVDKRVGKKASTVWLNHTRPQLNKLITESLEEVIDSYLWHYDLDPRSTETWRITKYENQEFFGEHPDDTFGTPRTVSMVYYPNDNYEGGELEFIHFGVTIKPKAKQLIVFPSSYIYEHRIKSIISGDIRYTIVNFFCNITEEERQSRLSKLDFPYKTKLKYISEIM